MANLQDAISNTLTDLGLIIDPTNGIKINNTEGGNSKKTSILSASDLKIVSNYNTDGTLSSFVYSSNSLGLTATVTFTYNTDGTLAITQWS